MINKFVSKIDQVSEGILLKVNFGISILVLFAHGGYLLFSPNKDLEDIFLVFTVLSSLIIFISCFVGFRKKELITKLLSFQSVLLLILLVYNVYTWISLLFHGFPEGIRWDPGLFTFFIVYPIYIFRRFILLPKYSKISFLKYIHVVVLIPVLIVDFAMFLIIRGQ